ncbi:MAG: sugar ABC transporter permease YjfF, partial [Specibacter sp.]
MTRTPLVAGPKARRTLTTSKYLPITVTLALFVLMFTVGSIIFPGFFSGQVILNLFVDNAFLLVLAVGMTFVILTG